MSEESVAGDQSDAFPAGGVGGVVFPSQHPDRQNPIGSRDMTLLARAVREGWDIPDEARAVLPKLAFGMAKGMRIDPQTRQPVPVSETAQLRAMRILVDMHGQNANLPPALDEQEGDASIDLNLEAMSVEELRLLERAMSGELRTRSGGQG
jgi:hypothetical protein